MPSVQVESLTQGGIMMTVQTFKIVWKDMTTDVVVNEDALVVESIRMLLVSAEVNEDELKYGFFDSDQKELRQDSRWCDTGCSNNDGLVLRVFNSSPQIMCRILIPTCTAKGLNLKRSGSAKP